MIRTFFLAVLLAGPVAASSGHTDPITPVALAVVLIPRGEVGLIFASVGASLTLGERPVISPEIYSAVVVMVIATTLATPPALRWRISRKKQESS